jgi:hypothetical protein
MHDVLRERLRRHLDALPEEQLYQVLDYIEFLSSKYARDRIRPPASPFQRFGERLEDKLRGKSVGMGAIRGTLEAMGTADRVVTGLTEAGRSLLREVGSATKPPSAPREAAPADATRVARPSPTQRPEDIPVDG